MASDLRVSCSSLGVSRRHLSSSGGTLAESGGIWRNASRQLSGSRGVITMAFAGFQWGPRPGQGIVRRGSAGGNVGEFASLWSSVRSDA